MPLIIAHRGASGYLPEHTLPAKAMAHAMGADYIEQDIVATRDDELIVLHDIRLDRVTDVAMKFPGRRRDDGRYYARDFDLVELRTLNAWERMNADGSAVYERRYPAQTGHFRVHTLAEEIELIQKLNNATRRQTGIYPEIKRPAWHREQGVDIAPLLLTQLAQYGYRNHDDPVFVQCFDDAELRYLREDLGCPLKLVQLIGENQWQEADTDYNILRTADGLKQVAATADAIGPWLSHLYTVEHDGENNVATGLTQVAHDLGLAVHPYTFRSDDLPAGFTTFDELVLFFALELGVDGLFTDFPDTARQILKDGRV